MSSLSNCIYSWCCIFSRNLTNIDISGVVIKQMLQAHAKQRPELEFLQMDVLNMEFEDNKFNVVLDKGTLDALMSDDSPESRQRIETMFKVS